MLPGVAVAIRNWQGGGGGRGGEEMEVGGEAAGGCYGSGDGESTGGLKKMLFESMACAAGEAGDVVDMD